MVLFGCNHANWKSLSKLLSRFCVQARLRDYVDSGERGNEIASERVGEGWKIYKKSKSIDGERERER